MEFAVPLVRGRLGRRYKRFFADVVLDDGSEVTAHCPNPGAMLGLSAAGLTVWLSKSPDPKRKLAYTWELVETPAVEPGAWVTCGVNTMLPNRIAAEAIESGHVAELAGYATLRREVKYGQSSRVDLLLEAPDRPPCFVEVKNCHLLRGGRLAEFPDSVTSRGLKHLEELTREAAAGARAVMLFVIQRTDCDAFDTAGDIDRAYAAGLSAASRAGVEVLCYDCDISLTHIRLNRRLPWRSAPKA
jgi:sugar fermentation stimulation protein A